MNQHQNESGGDRQQELAPEGISDERWKKHCENASRVQETTGLLPFGMSDGWEKAAVIIMDQRDALLEACQAALSTIDGLADQQAMPDDSYLEGVAVIRAAIQKATGENDV